MLLKALSLENIRSYTRERIEFSAGMTLLAGDIGSGKSSILLALEFALFGIQRGELSGASLLRHGAQRGEVRLDVEISGKLVTITRALKKSSTGIVQDTGSIVIDGIKTEGTAQELKAKVLELLNYPQSLLSKGKRPLFRYTVYTPQEEMKAIIYEKADERLDTLRRLFDIDKYKRVRENAIPLIRELRKEETDLKARIDQLSQEKVDIDEIKMRLLGLEKKENDAKKKIEGEKKTLADEEKELNKLEKQRFALEDLKRKEALAKHSLTNLQERQEQVTKDKQRVEEQIKAVDLKESDVDEKDLEAKHKILIEAEKKIHAKEEEMLKQETQQESVIKDANGVMDKIATLEHCPTCKQDVDGQHKATITGEEERKIKAAKERLAHLTSLKPELEKKRLQLEDKKKEILQKEKLIEANKVKLKALQDQKDHLKTITETLATLAEQRKEQEAKLKKLTVQVEKHDAVDEKQYGVLKRKIDEKKDEISQLLVTLAETKKDIENLEKDLERAQKQEKEKQNYEQDLKKKQQELHWLNKQLLAVSHTIEKALFTNIYGLFNEYFKEWFGMLMEDETITVRLDADFAPIIVQNGYETSIEHLSGGEKTSIALAYRLSLNKVINEFLSHINTRDLLILDEPTDGFSSEQLDRVREVLDQLKLQQIVIVSHEQQMEGYVDKVIRIQKDGHESSAGLHG